MNKFYYCLLLISFLLSCFVAYNSYGTGDVSVVGEWTRGFFRDGFWMSFSRQSTYPHLLNVLFLVSSTVALQLGESIGSNMYVFLYKLPAIGAFAAVSFLLFKISRTDVSRFTNASLLLNPAILLHTSILGYMDAMYILCLVVFLVSMYGLHRQQRKLWHISVMWCVAVTGPLFKWQFLIFIPILLAIVGALTVRLHAWRHAAAGLCLGCIIIFGPLLLGARQSQDIQFRVRALQRAYHRITHENFVVAHFPNVWQLINFYRTNPAALTSWDSVGASLAKPLPYWSDARIKEPWRVLYDAVWIGIILICAWKIKRHHLRLSPHLAASLSLWSIFIYVMTATGVHENHFISGVILTAYIYALKPSVERGVLLVIISAVNALNLNFFYGLGSTGVFGYNATVLVYGLNTSVILAIVLLAVFSWKFYSLIKSSNEYLGW